jgi:uncharacterized Zn finger protein (UPF0148 family)
MSYSVNDKRIRSWIGSPFCDKCDSVLIREEMAGKYFCPKCDKEEIEQFYKEAKEKRFRIYKKRNFVD